MPISIPNILKGSLQPKLKGASVWPFNAYNIVVTGRVCHIWSLKNSDVPVLYRENWPKSTAVITGVIFTCPGRAGPVFRLDLLLLNANLRQHRPSNRTTCPRHKAPGHWNVTSQKAVSVCRYRLAWYTRLRTLFTTDSVWPPVFHFCAIYYLTYIYEVR